MQRVSRASVAVDGEVKGAIEEPGLLVLVGVTHDDTPRAGRQARGQAVGPAHPGRREILLRRGRSAAGDQPVHPLRETLAKGRRPSWSAAAPGPVAEPLVDAVVAGPAEPGRRVETGVFGADMKISLVNDGPVTIIVDL